MHLATETVIGNYKHKVYCTVWRNQSAGISVNKYVV